MARTSSKISTEKDSTYLDKVNKEVQSNQSKLSLVLGALIVLVVGILLFNYLQKNKPEIGPAQQTQLEQLSDVSPDKLPGKYTVKEGDTLFNIADKYYKDGYKYPEITKENNMDNPDLISTGQVLKIPKLSEVPSDLPSPNPSAEESLALGTGGGNTTVWGPRIEGDSYIVVEGDWLSTIAGRAYGDIYAYNKIAEANNLTNPNLIEPGMTLKLPR